MKFRLTILVTGLSVACAFWFLPAAVKWPIVVAIVVISSIYISFGVINIASGFFYPTISRNGDNKVLLTFDDGPDPKNTLKILQTLREQKVRAVFFPIGKKAAENPNLIQQIINDGHLLGNHTYSHNVFFAMKSGSFVSKEIDKAEELLKQFGSRVSFLFRPPIGYLNPIIARKLAKRKATVLGWALRSFDTVLNEERLLQRLLSKTKNGDIVLFHDTQGVTVEVLPEYIETMRQRGIIFVSDTENLFR